MVIYPSNNEDNNTPMNEESSHIECAQETSCYSAMNISTTTSTSPQHDTNSTLTLDSIPLQLPNNIKTTKHYKCLTWITSTIKNFGTKKLVKYAQKWKYVL